MGWEAPLEGSMTVKQLMQKRLEDEVKLFQTIQKGGVFVCVFVDVCVMQEENKIE